MRSDSRCPIDAARPTVSRQVGPTGVVEHKKIRYSMPPESIGFSGTFFLYPDRVRSSVAAEESLDEG